MPMKNSNDTIGNRTCDLPACSTVPQPTAPLRAPAVPQGIYYYNTSYVNTVQSVTLKARMGLEIAWLSNMEEEMNL